MFMQELVHIANINMRKLRLQGRKMAESGKEFGKYDNQQRKNSELSGATTRSDGKCDFEGRRDFCVGRKFEDKSSSSSTGFVAFNSDYHGPKQHPPKHN